MALFADYLLIAERLRATLRTGCQIDAAQLKLLGLAQLRLAAGAQWPALQNRIRTRSMAILSRFTHADDVVLPASDGFLIVLAEDRPGEPRMRCAAMNQALVSSYAEGSGEFLMLKPELTTRRLSAGALADWLSSNAPSAAATSMDAQAPGSHSVACVTLVETRGSRKAVQLHAPVHVEGKRTRIAYNPEFVVDGCHGAADYLDLDLAVLASARGAFDRSPPLQRAIIGLTVHASTMQRRRTRESYLEAFLGAWSTVQPRPLVTICEIERGTPLMSIAAWCNLLSTRGARLALDFHYTDHSVERIGAAGVWAAGFHLPLHSGAQQRSQAARTHDQLRYWSRTIRGQNIRLIVHGFQDAQFFEDARGTIDLASGDALWPFSATAPAPA